MTSKTFAIFSIGLLSVSLFLVVTVLFSQAGAQGSKKTDTDKTTLPALSEVESKYVCMINDQLFNKEQIPVEVEGENLLRLLQKMPKQL